MKGVKNKGTREKRLKYLLRYFDFFFPLSFSTVLFICLCLLTIQCNSNHLPQLTEFAIIVKGSYIFVSQALVFKKRNHILKLKCIVIKIFVVV